MDVSTEIRIRLPVRHKGIQVWLRRCLELKHKLSRLVRQPVRSGQGDICNPRRLHNHFIELRVAQQYRVVRFTQLRPPGCVGIPVRDDRAFGLLVFGRSGFAFGANELVGRARDEVAGLFGEIGRGWLGEAVSQEGVLAVSLSDGRYSALGLGGWRRRVDVATSVGKLNDSAWCDNLLARNYVYQV
jgi:hypothetical protein